MRSNHDPYTQLPKSALTEQLAAFTAQTAKVVAALEELAALSHPHIQAALRHHTAQRATVKATIAANKNSLYRAYVACTGDLSQAFTDTMADIEGQRAEFHAKERIKEDKRIAAIKAEQARYIGGSSER